MSDLNPMGRNAEALAILSFQQELHAAVLRLPSVLVSKSP